MAYPQAKRCLYDGTWFKSNLEGKAAESFDNLGIRWQYEPVVVRGSQFVGGQYTPDFYLPDMLCYVEVAGVWDDRHARNALAFFREARCAEWDDFDREARPTLLAVDGQGFMHGIGRSGLFDGLDIFLNRCRACDGIGIMASEGPYGCPLCGAWDGNHYVREIGRNLFDAAGVKRYGGR